MGALYSPHQNLGLPRWWGLVRMSKAAVSIAIAMAVALEVEACMMPERPIPGSSGIFGLYTVVSPQVALPPIISL